MFLLFSTVLTLEGLLLGSFHVILSTSEGFNIGLSCVLRTDGKANTYLVPGLSTTVAGPRPWTQPCPSAGAGEGRRGPEIGPSEALAAPKL